MAIMKENPRYSIISMRISEEERKHLKNLVETTHNSVSHIMREALNILQLTSTPKDSKVSE